MVATQCMAEDRVVRLAFPERDFSVNSDQGGIKIPPQFFPMIISAIDAG
jgi:hypothetical protein